MNFKSETSNWCSSCGEYTAMVTYATTKRDVHGHVVREGSWTTCIQCGMTLMEEPWTHSDCPDTPRIS